MKRRSGAMVPRRIAVTGTPGVGKTTLCALAQKHLGWRVVDVKGWAQDAGFVVGFDDEDQAHVIDVEGLSEEKEWEGRPAVTTLYDGHLAHMLPVDGAWVLRCDPTVMRQRLVARGYKTDKVRENLEAEALDIVLQECLDRFKWVVQRDATRRSAEDLLHAFADARLAGHDLEAVDWSDRLPV